jgi:hypothetical protein
MLPPAIDAQVRQRLEELIVRATKISTTTARLMSTSGFETDDAIEFVMLKNQTLSIINLLFGNIERGVSLSSKIDALAATPRGNSTLLGILKALKSDYDAGLLRNLSEIIEANISSDYLGQAEELIAGSGSRQFDHIPAAVLAGAVLEDALRRLCQRQSPPIDTHKPDGSPKTLDPLIADLQKANVVNKAKADLLRGWAKVRNYAAHGEFTQVQPQDVQPMIQAVKQFLADYL